MVLETFEKAGRGTYLRRYSYVRLTGRDSRSEVNYFFRRKGILHELARDGGFPKVGLHIDTFSDLRVVTVGISGQFGTKC